MQEIRDSGRTLFYVSHAPGSVRKMCDRVLVLEKGRLGFDGDVDEGIQYLKYDRPTTRHRRGERATTSSAPTSDARSAGGRRRPVTTLASLTNVGHGVSSWKLQFVVTQKRLRDLCDWCETCYSCEPSPALE